MNLSTKIYIILFVNVIVILGNVLMYLMPGQDFLFGVLTGVIGVFCVVIIGIYKEKKV